MRSWVLHFSTVAVLMSGAVAAELQVPGIGNFHVVNEHIYRGAQPSPQGFHNLAKLGVKTIVDLREGTSREAGESGVVTNEGMRYFHVPMASSGAPTVEQVYSVLHFLNDGANWPVFIHCRRGADRTGNVLACYRIAHDSWPNEKALREAKLDGMSPLERAMQRYILAFRPDSVHLAQIAVQ
jgi:tyrosine-protein phosphatase SIW14